MNLLRAYIDAWVRHDIAGVLATLTEDCVAIESYGPTYTGTARVEEWMRTWFEQGGSVTSWVVTRAFETPQSLIAEWTFSCVWNDRPATFDGATIALVDGGRIRYLREYATTAPLYEWTGTWR